MLIAPADSTAAAEIAPNFNLAKLVGDGKLAMANVDSVPAGKIHGKAALEKPGVWASVEARWRRPENVRAALALVSTGEAPVGIVYQTDAAADKKVKIVGTFPEDSHPPIIYPVAQTAESKDAETPAFLKCLQSAKAKACSRTGFCRLVPPASN